MIRLRKAAWAVSVCVLAGSLAACSSNNTEDLRTYVDAVKSRQQARIEPLPEFEPFETHLYQASEERDPFTPPVYSAPKSQVAKNSGNGITNMRNRSIILNGVLSIDSNPGKGTRIELTIKLPEQVVV